MIVRALLPSFASSWDANEPLAPNEAVVECRVKLLAVEKGTSLVWCHDGAERGYVHTSRLIRQVRQNKS